MESFKFLESASANGILLFILVIIMGARSADLHEAYFSPSEIAIDEANGILYVSSATSAEIAVCNSFGKNAYDIISLPGKPGGIALSRDKKILYAPISSKRGYVCVINTGSRKITGRILVGHTPVSPVISGDGAILYICNRFDNSISVIDLETGLERSRIRVDKEPVKAMLAPDDSCLLVIHLLPDATRGNNYPSSRVMMLNPRSYRIEKSISLPNGSTGLRGICFSPDGKYAYITHILGRYQFPTTQITRGWINTNALSIIDVHSRKLLNTVLLDDVDDGAANPWDVVCSPDGKYLYVALSGTHELCRIDRYGLHRKLNDRMEGNINSESAGNPGNVSNEISFTHGLKNRFRLSGFGPRDILLIQDSLYVAEYFSGSIGKWVIEEEVLRNTGSLSLNLDMVMNEARKGELLFHDAGICFQRWQSCASCHPDARSDGLNWDLLNDGIGNPKQTKSLLLAHQTPPAMVTGIRSDAETAVRSGIKYILFSDQPEEMAIAIDAYLKSLQPVTSPYGREEKNQDTVLRGKKLFSAAGCTDCHNGKLYTDKKNIMWVQESASRNAAYLIRLPWLKSGGPPLI